MNYGALFRSRSAVRVALVGVGEFGASFLAQSRFVENLFVPLLCDRSPERALRACKAAGLPEELVRRCETRQEAARALEAGQTVIMGDGRELMDLPFDILLEATGEPEIAARHASAALAGGKHVAMVSKEADSVVGPLLARKARTAGLVYTPVEGDQPSLLIGLVQRLKLLGLDILAAGKACEHDFLLAEDRQSITSNGKTIPVPGFEGLWTLEPEGVREGLVRRARACADLPRSTVPDFCELALVANATGLKPDLSSLHAPIARALEVPDILCLREAGGLLSGRGRLDVFSCLRREDEASFAGGVFAVVALPDCATGRLLRSKGMLVGRKAHSLLVYNPIHLLGLEAPISVLSACGLGLPTGAEAPQPVCDVAAMAVEPLAGGDRLALAERHSIPGATPLLLESGPLRPDFPVPYYLLPGCRLRRDVRAGEILTLASVMPPEDSLLWDLRREQDQIFFGAS